MTALYIILGIILLIFVLLWFPVVCDISYLNNKFTLKVKYLFLTIFSVPSKKKKKRPKKPPDEENEKSSESDTKKSEKEEKASEEKTKPEKSSKTKKENTENDDKNDEELLTGKKKGEKEEKKSSVAEKLDLVKKVAVSCKKNIFGILNNISFTDISYECVVATDEAAQTALMYGKISAGVWNFIALMQMLVRKFKVKKINIQTDFLKEKTTHSLSLKIKITPAVIIWHLVVIVIKFLVIKNRKENENGKQQG